MEVGAGIEPPRWFVHPAVDALVAGGGSIVVYLLFRMVPAWGASAHVAGTGAALVWVVNHPHFASTGYRLYHVRTNAAQYPMTAILTPAMIVAAMAASFASPAVVAPAFVLMYQLWSPYHFSGQSLGVTMLYARRHGFTVDRSFRRMITWFIFSTFVLQIARFQASTTSTTYFGVVYPSLGIPGWVPDVVEVAMWSSLGLIVTYLVVGAARSQPTVPLIVLLPAAAQFVWFAATPAGQFAYLVPCFHSLQYLMIAWNVQLKESLDVRRRVPSVRFVTTETMRWYALIVVVGVAMFWLLPRIGASFGRPAAFSTAIVLAGLQMHHFFVDGVIWRLRDPTVRDVLSSSIAEIAGARSGRQSVAAAA